jgi:hypothetical protein
MKITKAFKRLDAYLEKNKMYYTFLELALLVWLLYVLGVLQLLHISWITQHLSNFIGTIIVGLIIIGPRAFYTPSTHWYHISIAVFVMVAINLILEIINPIQTIDLPFFYWENFNMADTIDAVFGIIGAAFVAGALLSRLHSKTR